MSIISIMRYLAYSINVNIKFNCSDWRIMMKVTKAVAHEIQLKGKKRLSRHVRGPNTHEVGMNSVVTEKW
jgi:hypothetical protein